MKWKKITGILTAFSIILSGCGWAIQSEETLTKVSNQESSIASEQGLLSRSDGFMVGTLSNRLTVKISEEDLKDENLETGKYAVLSAQIHELDYQKLANSLFGKHVQLEHSDNGQVNSYTFTAENEDTFYYDTEQDRYSTAAFISSFQTQIQYIFRSSPKTEIMNEAGNTTAFFKKDSDLAFCSAEKAEKTVRELLEGCGLSLFSEADVYTLTKERLKQVEDYLDGMGELNEIRSGESLKKEKWTEEDECYYMIFRGSVENLPVYQYRRMGREEELSAGTSIELIYSAEGIRYLYISNPYRMTGEISKKQNVVSMEEALVQLKELYENILDENKKTVEQCYLCYLPVYEKSGIILKPAWYLEVHTEYEQENDISDQWNEYYLDAVSCEWITEE